MGIVRLPRLLPILTFLAVVPSTLSAAEPDSLSRAAAPDTLPRVVEIGEIEVSASRTRTLIVDSPREARVVGGQEAGERLAMGTADALNEAAEVHLQKTSLGGGSPILRGLAGNRVLMLVDGIRLNNSTFRLGVNQYLNTVGPDVLDHIEVLPGPGSALFGSDALGGVVNVVGKEPSAERPELEYAGTVTSAEGSMTHILTLNRAFSPRFAVLVGGAVRDLNDFRAGGGDTQFHTGFSEWGSNARVVWKPETRHTFTAAYQTTRQEDVPRTDRIVAGRDSVNFYDPQNRELAFLRYDTRALDPVAQALRVTLSWNRQKEGRRTISATKTTQEINELDDAETIGLSIEARSVTDPKTIATYGADVYWDFVDSRANLHRLDTGVYEERPGKLPDDGRHTSGGLFLRLQHSLRPDVMVSGSLRGSLFRLSGTPQGDFGRVVLDNRNVTGAGEIRKSFGKGHSVFAALSQAFRAPNMEDAMALGLTNKGYDVPNPDLGPEKSITLETGLKLAGRTDREHGVVTLFATRIEDVLERTPTTFNGADSLNGEPVFHQTNQGRADLAGASVSGSWRPAERWSARGSVSYTFSQNRETKDPLTRTPPLRGSLALRREIATGWAEAAVACAAKADRLSPDDLRDTRIPEGGTPGYAVLHLRGAWPVSPDLVLRAGLENVFDRNYRVHGSGIDMPGRNLTLGVGVRLDR